MENKKNIFAFFGTDEFSVGILEGLSQNNLLPDLIIAGADKPVGRKLIITPPPAKVWAIKKNIPVLQPASLRDFALPKKYDLCIVASYGKIIPQPVLDTPRFGTINVHPSLLPKLRGASPIESAILFENETGVSIMRLDAEMDHGPILAQQKTHDWSDDINSLPYADDLEKSLADRGSALLAHVIRDIFENRAVSAEQDHSLATFTKKIKKEDALIDPSADPQTNLRKIRAFHVWPRAYFVEKHAGHDIRIIVTRAKITDGLLDIERVTPEGKKEMAFVDFKRGVRA